MAKVLVIEDDLDLSGIMCDFLKNDGHEVKQVFDGEKGLQEASVFQPDLMILDIMLPKVDGIEICRSIRTYSHAPVIIISAKNSDMDKLLSLGVGADDYVTKPFSMMELTARVKAHLRRYTSFRTLAGNKKADQTQKQYGDLVIDGAAMSVKAFGKEISLTAKEFKLLDFLFDHPSQVFSKAQIIDQVWGFNEYLDDNTVAVYIGRLREKLSKADVGYIKTVWGMGYKWEK